ncbi:MAG: NAD(P)-dependent oxidoreductase [Lachnospiraceae bacterium]|nr:NAD(P)-dependent oxidoreductase [Lachnospiraceae bacterium]
MQTVTIAITGITGAMGEAVLERFAAQKRFHLRLLLHEKKKGTAVMRRCMRNAAAKISTLTGDIRDKKVCAALVDGADYVLHMAAVIPPLAEHKPGLAYSTNYLGTKRLTDAILSAGNRAALIDISTVAVYGNRDIRHPFGRVGDPLTVSVFDAYGLSKRRAERYVLEAGLKRFVVLRQTGVLYEAMLTKSLGDALLYHMPLNTPVEWVSASDSARLLYRLIAADLNGEDKDIWGKVFNIGGGAAARQTGYETFLDGFSLIGADPKKVFEPHWFATGNFHCFWFSDSDVLEEKYRFRREGTKDFWERFAKGHRLYGAGKMLPASLLKRLLFEPLTKKEGAPLFWKKTKNAARVGAHFGSFAEAGKQHADWETFSLVCERDNYDTLRRHHREKDLSHGYDESKKDGDLDLCDMREAAAFRGGACLSEEMQRGDLYTKLTWRCHAGHVFTAAPYTVLKAGHWCEDCQPAGVWNMNLLAAKVPFYAQVWYDTHEKKDRRVYYGAGARVRVEEE